MKTTAGKTKTVRPKARVVHIYENGHRGLIAVRHASSLKQALEEYFKESLAPKGWKKGRCVGNTLQISNNAGVKIFRALETYQKP